MANTIVRNSGAIELTTLEAEEALNFNIEAWEDGEELSPILFTGMPGVGKTDICRQCAEKHGMEFRVINLSNMAREDVGGMPVPVNQESGSPSIKYAPNDQLCFPEKDKKYLLLFDELTNVDEDTQKVAMRIFLEREVNGNKIPDNVFMVAAGNRSTDKSRTYPLISPLANRLAHYGISSDVDKWLSWGRMTGLVHPKILGFISLRPNFLHAMVEEENDPKIERAPGYYEGPWHSNRSVVAASKAVWRVEKKGLGLGVIRREVAARCGVAFASEFCSFYELAAEYDNIREVMLDPTKEAKIPTEPSHRYALSSALVYNLWQAHDDAEQEKLVKGFLRVASADGWGPQFGRKIMTEAVEGSAKVDKLHAAEWIVEKFPAEYLVWAKKYGKDNKSKV